MINHQSNADYLVGFLDKLEDIIFVEKITFV